MDEYQIEVRINRETSQGLGFGAEESVDRDVSITADLGDKTIEVQHSPDADVDSAVESFLQQLGVDEIDLS